MSNRLLSSLALLSLASQLCAADLRPNIVVILADDMGYADIGVHGCTDIPTPNIDRIATQGVRFTDAYANGSFCTPTRAALMSCRYQQRSGNDDLDGVTGPLPLGICTLPDRMRAAGYTTGMVGKWHLGGKDGYTPLDRGFDEFFGFLGGGHYYLPNPKGKGSYYAPIFRNRQPVDEQRYLTDAFGEEAAAFLQRHRESHEPLFLYLAFNAVHTPMQATSEDLQRFADIPNRQRRTYAAMLSAMDRAIGLDDAECRQRVAQHAAAGIEVRDVRGRYSGSPLFPLATCDPGGIGVCQTRYHLRPQRDGSATGWRRHGSDRRCESAALRDG
jgi:arylsulfatase A-like enzyme